MISYFVMMIYRHFDLKKYVNIKVEKKLIIESIIIYTFTLLIYYQKSIILHVICLLIVCIYAFITNKDFLKSSYLTVVKKIKR